MLAARGAMGSNCALEDAYSGVMITLSCSIGAARGVPLSYSRHPAAATSTGPVVGGRDKS